MTQALSTINCLSLVASRLMAITKEDLRRNKFFYILQKSDNLLIIKKIHSKIKKNLRNEKRKNTNPSSTCFYAD